MKLNTGVGDTCRGETPGFPGLFPRIACLSHQPDLTLSPVVDQFPLLSFPSLNTMRFLPIPKGERAAREESDMSRLMAAVPVQAQQMGLVMDECAGQEVIKWAPVM